MHTTHTNGHVPRKTLASQLDRLDGIIDSLAEGLNGAVTDAVRDAVTVAVRQAVEQLFQEILAHPELLRSLLIQVAPPALPVASVPQSESSSSKLGTACARAGGALGTGWHWLRDRTRAMPGKVRDGLRHPRVAQRLQSLRQAAGKAWELRGPLSLSVGAGLLLGVLAYAAGPFLSAVALGASGAAMTLTGILAAPFVKMWKALHAEGV